MENEEIRAQANFYLSLKFHRFNFFLSQQHIEGEPISFKIEEKQVVSLR